MQVSGIGNALLGNWEVGAIVNGRSGLPLEIGIVRPDVVIQCRNAAGCVVPSGAGGATTTFANGFVAQLPGTINAANPLPPGFIAVVNTPGGGASRNVRRPDLVAALVATALARLVPGRPGYWLDLGLMMFALYLAGCAVGSWLRDWVLSRHTPAV